VTEVFNEVVNVDRRGATAVVELNRPEARNAVNVAMAEGICQAVAACQDAGAIVITGADPAFCAGLDLRSLGVESLADLAPFVASVAGSKVPVIAAVNGPAVTGGFEVALAADFIVASERAAFADTHLRVGVYPGPVLVDLPRRVGPAWAREMSLTGNFIDAATALRIGLANHVVPHADLIPLSLELAAAIAEQDPAMVQMMRRDWDASVGTPLAEARRIHDEHRQAGNFGSGASAAAIAMRREAVIARAHDQRPSG
jgi:enoyl-CoA hydratase